MGGEPRPEGLNGRCWLWDLNFAQCDGGLHDWGYQGGQGTKIPPALAGVTVRTGTAAWLRAVRGTVQGPLTAGTRDPCGEPVKRVSTPGRLED